MTTSIGNALQLMVHPMVWMAGIYPGLSILLVFGIANLSGTYTATQIGLILFLLSPLVIGGVLGMIRYNDYSPILFLMQAKRHYFGIVMPAIIIALVIVITIILLLIPLSLIMGSFDAFMVTGLCIGVSIPVLLTTVFYAPVIVAENATVTQSLFKSVILVSYDLFASLKFWIAAIILQCMIFFGVTMAFTVLIYEYLEEYATLSIAEQQAKYATLTIDEWMTMLGGNEFILVLFTSVCVAIVSTFLICYLFVCYEDAKEIVPFEPIPHVPTPSGNE